MVRIRIQGRKADILQIQTGSQNRKDPEGGQTKATEFFSHGYQAPRIAFQTSGTHAQHHQQARAGMGGHNHGQALCRRAEPRRDHKSVRQTSGEATRQTIYRREQGTGK